MVDVSAECDGYGFLFCFCAGDFCACGTDGSPCLGCERCAPHDEMLAGMSAKDRREELAFIRACEQDEETSYQTLRGYERRD